MYILNNQKFPLNSNIHLVVAELRKGCSYQGDGRALEGVCLFNLPRDRDALHKVACGRGEQRSGLMCLKPFVAELFTDR